MRDDPIDGSRPDPRWGAHSVYPPEPAAANPLDGIPPLDYPGAHPPKKQRRWGRRIVRGLADFIVLFVVLVGWLAVTAPLSKSLQPPTPPSVTLLASDGTPIAKRGAIVGKPVEASKLSKYVTGACISIEDRRFYSHWGIDPRGIARALFRDIGAGGVREGASTITQQLAKNAFLDSDRTAGRAMIGCKDHAASPCNRATQARRQPGSTFKLFVYLAAMRAGMTPDDMIEDEPVTIAGWSPKNSEGTYEGKITLRRAFQKSSNVAAARLIQKVGPAAVIKAARDLGISTPIPEEASIALGTSTVSLLELTSAFAAVAGV